MTEFRADDMQKRLNALAEKGQRHLRWWASASKRGHLLVLASYVSIFLSLAVLCLLGISALLEAGFGAPDVSETLALTVICPLVFALLAMAWAYFRAKPGRTTALTLFDQHMDSRNRLVTADEFVKETQISGFCQAAIEDAERFVDRAEQVSLPSVHSLPLFVTRGAKAVVMLAAVLSTVSVWTAMDAGDLAAPKESSVVLAPSSVAEVVEAKTSVETEQDRPVARISERRVVAHQDKASSQDGQADKSEQVKSAGDAQQSVSQSGPSKSAGASASAKASSGLSTNTPDMANAGKKGAAQKRPPNPVGSPATKQPKAAKPAGEKQQPTESQTADATVPPTKKPQADEGLPEKAEEKDSASVGGKPSSTQSGNGVNTTPNKKTDSQVRMPQNAAPNRVSREGVKANEGNREARQANDRKKAGSAPQSQNTNQNKSSGRSSQKQPSGQPRNNDAGRKPGANGKNAGRAAEPIKKSRGVASLMLGVPLPDYIQGKPGDGYTKKTQEKSDPKPESNDAQQAQGRGQRTGRVGSIEHPVMDPAMQRIVRSYFNQQDTQSSNSEEDEQ